MGKEETVLKRLERTSDRYWNVPRETGEFLMMLARIKKAKNILEIGTSNGYSGIFLAMAAKESKGRLTTIEGDWGRASEARKNFIEAGVMRNSEIIIGEAQEITKRLAGQFDLVFIDANKEQYIEYIRNIEKKNLKEKAVIVADNIISHKKSVKDYVEYMGKRYHSGTFSVGSGLMVSIRK